MHGCTEKCLFSSEYDCWQWLQHHLMTATRGQVPHPGGDIHQVHVAMMDSVLRKLTESEVQQWQDYREKQKGKRSSSDASAQNVEVQEKAAESKRRPDVSTSSKHPAPPLQPPPAPPTPVSASNFPPPPPAPNKARHEAAPLPPEDVYKRIIARAEVAEKAANKMKTVSEACLQLFADQGLFFKGVKEEMSQELALLMLPN